MNSSVSAHGGSKAFRETRNAAGGTPTLPGLDLDARQPSSRAGLTRLTPALPARRRAFYARLMLRGRLDSCLTRGVRIALLEG